MDRIFLDKEEKQFVIISWKQRVKNHDWWLVKYGSGYEKIISNAYLKKYFEEIKL